MKSTIDILYEATKECEACDLRSGCIQVVCGRGFPYQHKHKGLPIDFYIPVVFIGEGPGKDEDEEGEPFVGDSGYILELWIEWLKLQKKEFFITNIVKCRPENNKDPKQIYINTCTKEWLYKEIKFLNPWVIVPVGRLASAHFLGPEFKQGITSYNGEFYKTSKEWHSKSLDKKHRLVYPIIHPSWYLRRGQQESEEAWSPQLRKLKRYIRARKANMARKKGYHAQEVHDHRERNDR